MGREGRRVGRGGREGLRGMRQRKSGVGERVVRVTVARAMTDHSSSKRKK